MRNRRGFITVIEVMILIVVVALVAAVARPRGSGRNRPAAIKKACVSNMKTIEGAVELYLMEKSVRSGTRLYLDQLKAEGYLKTEPKCSKNGRYEIRVKTASGTTAGATDIRCDIHGTIDDTTSGL